MPRKPIATFVQQITENVRLHLKNIYACGELDEGSTSKESLEVRPEPQGVFYDGQLWDARAFVDRLVKSARKSLLLVDNFSRMPPRDSVAGGIRRFSASLGPSRLREEDTYSRCSVSSSSRRPRPPAVAPTRRGYSNPARAGGLPPRARPGFPLRRFSQGSRQEVLRIHEVGLRRNPGLEGEIMTRPLHARPRCGEIPPLSASRLDDLSPRRLGPSRPVDRSPSRHRPFQSVTRAAPKVKHEFVAQMLLTVSPILWYILTCRASPRETPSMSRRRPAPFPIPDERIVLPSRVLPDGFVLPEIPQEWRE